MNAEEIISKVDDGSRVVRAMVAKSDVEGCVKIAAPGRCGEWIEVPAELVDEVEPVGRSACGDHSHGMASIKLRVGRSPLELSFIAMLERALARPGGPQASGGWCTTSPCAGGVIWCTCVDEDGNGYTYPCGSCVENEGGGVGVPVVPPGRPSLPPLDPWGPRGPRGPRFGIR